ncbi:Presqualene diphosphate phosphatase, partial [Brachionus plicatilis]
LIKIPKIYLIIFEYVFHGVPWFIISFGCFLFGNKIVSYRSLTFIKGLIIDLITVGLLKYFTRRQRPSLNSEKEMVIGTNIGPDKFSFPSGHSSRAVLISCLLIDIIRQYFSTQKLYSIASIAFFVFLAIGTCLSRILLLRHYLSDVLAVFFFQIK